ncbi:hypothetical protein [Streptomyces sp. NPDC101132]|uniref:hypothetical protein n=1 Tax=Streptomyces sp. NPDC101132 TaxID=3366110 RepID=UPI0038080217
MIARRLLGTGPRPVTDSPAPPLPRARLAAELAPSAPAAEADGPAARSAAESGRRRLGHGAADTGA